MTVNLSLNSTIERVDEPVNLNVGHVMDKSRHDVDVNPSPIHKSLYRSQEKHFWFASRNAFITQMMQGIGLRPPARLLEVGCGTGTVLTHLTGQGYYVDGVEMQYELCRRAADHCPEATLHCADIMQTDLEELKGTYQGVGLFDVLEHIADPSPFLAHCAEFLADDGFVVGTVPALMALWSALDRGHYRRYNRETLTRELEEAHLRPIFIGYFFQTLVPAIWLQRKLIASTSVETDAEQTDAVVRGLEPPPGPINIALQVLCSAERVLHRHLPLGRFPGASLFFAASR